MAIPHNAFSWPEHFGSWIWGAWGRYLRFLRGLPASRVAVEQLSQAWQEDFIDLDKAAEAIGRDPALAAWLLRLSNRKLRNNDPRAGTIEGALVLLNPAEIGRALRHVPVARDAGFLEELRRHSRAVARCSEVLAEVMGHPQPEMAFSAGFLHDLGKIALWQEGKTIGGSEPSKHHAAIGGWFAFCWKFPPSLVAAIEFHHHPHAALEQSRLAMIVSVADQVAHACEAPPLCPETFSARVRKVLQQRVPTLPDAKLEIVAARLSREAGSLIRSSAVSSVTTETQQDLSQRRGCACTKSRL